MRTETSIYNAKRSCVYTRDSETTTTSNEQSATNSSILEKEKGRKPAVEHFQRLKSGKKELQAGKYYA